MTNTQISNKKLKAIVFTDIVNFTQLSAKDEQHALKLIDKQREILKPIVENHSGEWLKEIGDGLLFSFDSSLDAVNCSIEIQKSLRDIEDLNLRVGIHQGDIFIKDGDVFGDDVNITSRIETYAPIGGIAISDKVDKDISGVKDIKTTFIGHKKLKGVTQETQIKCISSHSLPVHQTNILAKLFFYTCCTIGLLYFFAFSIEFLTYEPGSLLKVYPHPIQTYEMFYILLMKSLTFFLIGYTTFSYYKGVRFLPQKYTAYFSFIYIIIFFLIEILVPFFVLELSTFQLTFALILILISLFISSLVYKFLKTN
tara:strand:+ start:143 stop:1075 length:933 start_codon:yes stop_codon:yes gene_type:complete